jgi:hypothetical protein
MSKNLLFGSTVELLRRGVVDFEAENLRLYGHTYGQVGARGLWFIHEGTPDPFSYLFCDRNELSTTDLSLLRQVAIKKSSYFTSILVSVGSRGKTQ